MTEDGRQMAKDGRQVPYRHVNNWMIDAGYSILDGYEWLNGSLVNLDNIVN